jgi:hypothetical protein
MTGSLAATERPTKTLTAAESPTQEASQSECHDIKQVPWYAAMLCRLGIHRGEWRYQLERDCAQWQICERCGQTRVRTKHQSEWRYVRNGSCKQVKICRRCEVITGQRVRHAWGKTYSVDWSTDAHRCMRC